MIRIRSIFGDDMRIKRTLEFFDAGNGPSSFTTVFTPGYLFTSGAQGAWYDPSDFSTLFQDAAGTTPVTAVEQPVRLMRDRSGRGNDATAPNDASRPVLRARYNLLTFSEQFDNAAWQKNNGSSVTANAVVAPDGTTTADQIDLSASELSRVQQPLSGQPTADYTFSVWLRVPSGTASIRFGTASDLNTITVTSTWQRFTVTKTVTAPAAQPNHTIRNEAGGGAKTLYAWGAQILTAADQTTTGGAYQRVGAATDYDTSNPVWRPYLAFDGSDDSMSTASVDFSTTDAVSVFAGAHKASDAVWALLVEFTANSSSQSGFGIFAPWDNGLQNYGVRSRGTTGVGVSGGNTFPAPVTNVLTMQASISAPSLSLTVNRSAYISSTASQGTGNYANAPLFIGSRNNTSNPYNGRLYSLLVLGRTATAAEISAMEAWVAGKTGVTL